MGSANHIAWHMSCTIGQFCKWAIAFNIRTPPVEDLPLLLTPEDWLKLHSPLKTSIKYGFTLEELGHTPEEYRFTPEECCEN